MTGDPSQQELFGGTAEGARIVRSAPPDEQLRELSQRLPRNLYLGTSSWSFPGWVGLVYQQLYSTAALARHGLAAYAEHPLLNAVNLDSTFYKPATASQLASYARQVPEHFRFVVKAYAGLTTVPDSPMAARRRLEPVFLDSRFATRQLVEPLLEGLGARLGAVLFQISPLGPGITRAPGPFIQRLGEFLQSLPRGPVYAVELRDPQFLGEAYQGMLRAAGAVHCANVHSRMPLIDQQVQGVEAGPGPLLLRWMLQPSEDYESAAARFAPFDRLRAPDERNRARIAALVRRGLSCGRDVYVLAANNAEGSAPLTLLELAKTIAASSQL